jgi:2-polyprenyl-3-methyl-5-hydroxy-6-metoxy-1,4-benzoquinol methylase
MKRLRNSFKGRGSGPLPKLSGPSLKRLSPGSQVGIFDVIIAIDVLEHLPREELLNTLVITYKFLAPGGRFILSRPNALSPFAPFDSKTFIRTGILPFSWRVSRAKLQMKRKHQ